VVLVDVCLAAIWNELHGFPVIDTVHMKRITGKDEYVLLEFAGMPRLFLFEQH
jgi:hypothetical protein